MSKELEYEINNFVNLLNKDCMNLMECLKKQSEDNKPILYLGKHYEKVILPYEEYKKMCNRLESIDNANPSEALECLEALEQDIKDRVILAEDRQLKLCAIIKQALIKAQEPKQYVDELKLVEKKLKALDLLMQELDCKDFADLRKYARCGYEKLNKHYLKWEDLEFDVPTTIKVKMGDTKYLLSLRRGLTDFKSVVLRDNNLKPFLHLYEKEKQFFNDLHLERVEE